MSSSSIVAVSAPVRSDADAVSSVRLRTTYVTALENARLVPLVTPPLHDDSYAESLVRQVGGLVLTGGADIDPAYYGMPPHPKLGATSAERDSWELALVRSAARNSLPILAICRGIQVLNVALGGTLIQDLPSSQASSQTRGRASDINHDPDLPRSNRSHAVEIDSDSRTARAVGVTQLRVNSVHHQAIDRVAGSLRVVATAPDGTIEAVESAPDSGWWCVGVQWHPEELTDCPESGATSLFAAFAEAVRARQGATRQGAMSFSP